MAKSAGLIGNFRGKVGNLVGYELKESANKQVQVIRSYQPVVKDAMSTAQAIQRVRFAPVFTMYRALRSVIDRGQEGVPYGSLSRHAWLRKVLSDFDGPYYKKDTPVTLPLKCDLTHGTLTPISVTRIDSNYIRCSLNYVNRSESTYVGEISDYLLEDNSWLREGDQITFVFGSLAHPIIYSFILNTRDGSQIPVCRTVSNQFNFKWSDLVDVKPEFAAVVVSRAGARNAHLRSTATIALSSTIAEDAHYSEASRLEAIASYMSPTANDDWPTDPEE